MEITNEEITFKASDGKELAAYLSKPKASGQYPGILLSKINRCGRELK